jgi:biotin carboxyl carrier protein
MVPEGGGEAVQLVLDGDRARVGGGAERVASAEPHPDGLAVTLDGRRRVWACARDGEMTRVGIDGRAWAFREQPLAPRRGAPDRGAALEAPMPGSVLDVRVRAGDSVRAGDVLVVLESMKMELEVVAPEAGTVERLSVVAGDRVRGGQLLVAIGRAA